jgi:GH24 family phage-related lysozyme (muramidase)
VELDYGAGIWYLWSDHWHLPWQKSSQENGSSSESAPEATDKAQPGTGQIPQRAIELIKEFEGCEKKLPDGRVQAYPDPNPKTGWKLPTIGYGSTRCPDGSPVRKGQIITRDEAEEYLMYDLDKIRRPALEKIPTWKDMNENQRAALYSFSFNLGSGFYRGRNFESITKVCDSPQRWNDQEWVKEQFVKYRNPGTNVESGLRRRREAEAKLFCTPPSTPQPEKGKAATSTTTAQSFGNLNLGNDLASRIIKYMKTKGYQVFTNPREYNIVYVEGMNPNGTLNDDRPNEFNDLRMVIEFKNGKPEIVGSWEATTEPGDKYTYSPQNPNGAARIKFGQYQAWIKAWHPMPKSSKSHEALFQTQPIEVYRDSNKDFRRDGDRVQKGIFGINQHWGYDLPKNHFGIDVAAPKNTAIKAAADGVVVSAGYTVETGYSIAIQHPNNVITMYKHNSVLLKPAGAAVKAGEAIALIGNSGENTSGPHLHFELWYKGRPMDPTDYINFN